MSLGANLPTLLAPSTGVVKYVATTGNDTTGDGSQGNPWASFQKLLDTLTPGQVGEIASGVYTSPTLARHTLSARSGTVGDPIEVRAAAGATVQIRPKTSGGTDAFIVTQASKYWRFRNLIFELAETGSNHQNMWISDAGGGCTDIEFWNCTFRLAKQGTGTFIAEGNTRCYYINCKAHDNIDTVVPGTQRQGFYITGDACGAINCITYNHDGYGLQVRTNDADGPVGVFVVNCVAYNNKPSGASEYSGFMCEGLADGCQFWNNIAYDNRNGFRGLTAGSPSPHNVANKNIANANDNTQYGRAGSTTALDYSALGAGSDYVGPGDNLTSDPLFIDPVTFNFRLQAGSPAIGYGNPDWCPTFDYENNLRANCDAGAYAFSVAATPTVNIHSRDNMNSLLFDS